MNDDHTSSSPPRRATAARFFNVRTAVVLSCAVVTGYGQWRLVVPFTTTTTTSSFHSRRVATATSTSTTPATVTRNKRRESGGAPPVQRNDSDIRSYEVDDDFMAGLDDDGYSNYGNQAPAGDEDPPPPISSRIQYRLVHGRPYQQQYGFHYTCDPTPPNGRPLPPRLLKPGMVDFVTDITTSLKIAVVGDSLGVQIGHRLEESMTMPPHEFLNESSLSSSSYQRVAYVETNWNNLVLSYPVRGGGALLSYRVNGMLWDDMQTYRHRRQRRLRQRRLQQPHSSAQQHHHRHRHLQAFFKPQKFNRTEVDVALQQQSSVMQPPLRNVNVLVQRVTYPWVRLQDITWDRLVTNTQMAANMFGMETLVYVNFHFTNNVLDQTMYELFLDRQQVVRNFTRSYVQPTNSSLQRILLLDLDRLVDQFNMVNARRIGFDTVNEPFEHWMLSQTLGHYNPKALYRKHIAQVCGKRVPNHTDWCPHNMIFVDGIHLCPSTFAGRITAGISCLINCAEVDRRTRPLLPSTVHGPNSRLRICERQCNDKYMTLKPIPVSEMVEFNESKVG